MRDSRENLRYRRAQFTGRHFLARISPYSLYKPGDTGRDRSTDGAIVFTLGQARSMPRSRQKSNEPSSRNRCHETGHLTRQRMQTEFHRRPSSSSPPARLRLVSSDAILLASRIGFDRTKICAMSHVAARRRSSRSNVILARFPSVLTH